jgi:hypothetical protein
MAWSLAVAQLSAKGADSSHLPIEQVIRLLQNDLVEGGSAQRIGDTVFVKCRSNYLCVRDDGFIEYGESAA